MGDHCTCSNDGGPEASSLILSFPPDNRIIPERHFFSNYSVVSLNGIQLEPIVMDENGRLTVDNFPNSVMAKLNSLEPKSEEKKLRFILLKCGTLHNNLLVSGFDRCSETLLYAVSIFQKRTPFVLCARETYDRSYYYLIPILRQLHLAQRRKKFNLKKGLTKKAFEKRLQPFNWRWGRHPRSNTSQVLIFCPEEYVSFLLARIAFLCEGSFMTVAAVRAATDRVPMNTTIIITDPKNFDTKLKFSDLRDTKFCVFDFCDILLRRNYREKITLILNRLSPTCHRSIVLAFLSKTSVRLIDSKLGKYAALLCGKYPSMTMFTRHTLFNCEDAAKPSLAATLVNRFQGMNIIIYVKDHAVKAVLANELRDLANRDQPQIFSRTNRIFVLREDMDILHRIKTLSEFESMLDAVLITSDIASEDLNFQDILILINYDLPEDIETFINRHSCIGRTPVLPPFYSFPHKSDKSLKLMHTLLMQHWREKEGFNKPSAESFSFFSIHDFGISSDLVALLNELQEKVPPFLEEVVKGTEKSPASGWRKSKEITTKKFLPEFFRSDSSLGVPSFSNFQSIQHLPIIEDNVT